MRLDVSQQKPDGDDCVLECMLKLHGFSCRCIFYAIYPQHSLGAVVSGEEKVQSLYKGTYYEQNRHNKQILGLKIHCEFFLEQHIQIRWNSYIYFSILFCHLCLKKIFLLFVPVMNLVTSNYYP